MDTTSYFFVDVNQNHNTLIYLLKTNYPTFKPSYKALYLWIKPQSHNTK